MIRDLIDFLKQYYRQIVLAFICATVVAAAAIAYSVATPASYRAYAVVMVSSSDDLDFAGGVSSLVRGVTSNPNEVILQSLTSGTSFPIAVMKDDEISSLLKESETLENRDYSDAELLREFPNIFSISNKNQAGSFEISAVTSSPETSAAVANKFVEIVNERITSIRINRDMSLIENIRKTLDEGGDSSKLSVREALFAQLEQATLTTVKSVIDEQGGLTVIDSAAPVYRRHWPSLRVVVPFVFAVVFSLVLALLVRRNP